MTTRKNRATPIMRVRATCLVPFGLMPVTAAAAVTSTARPSHASQVMTRPVQDERLISRFE
jgi:hypothetical protein